MATLRDLETTLDRRQLLARMAVSALILGAHDSLGSAVSDADTRPDPMDVSEPGDGPRILELRLLTAARMVEMRAFYADTLGLPVTAEDERHLVIEAGATEITFVHSPDERAAPFYHFAFNIPENKILAARAWQLERTPLFTTPQNLRDPAYPDDVRHFRNWNAHSVFFWDPAGNVLEYIARHDLGNAGGGGFSTADILYASEIAFVVDEVSATAREIQARFDLGQYRNGSEIFWAAGDERGLLLLFKRGRDIGDRLRDRSAFAEVFTTRARIRGEPGASYDFPGYPHLIEAGP